MGTEPVQVATAPVQLPSARVQLATAPVLVATALVQVATAPVQVSTAPVQLATASVQVSTGPVQLATAPVQVETTLIQLAFVCVGFWRSKMCEVEGICRNLPGFLISRIYKKFDLFFFLRCSPYYKL